MGSEAGAVVFDERFDASALHSLRERVAACAVVAGLPDDRAADLVLAMHELAANAVKHGGGAERLLMRAADSTLHCQVSDAGPGGDRGQCGRGTACGSCARSPTRSQRLTARAGPRSPLHSAVWPARCTSDLACADLRIYPVIPPASLKVP